MKTTFKIMGVVTALAAAGCDGEGDAEIPEAEARSTAAAIAGGEAASAVRAMHDDVAVWSVDVTMANGATIEVELQADSGELVEASDKEGPFDYDLTPVDGPAFTKIVEHAQGEVAGEVVAWKLEREAEAEPVAYEWELYVRDGEGQLWEVFLHAADGHATGIEATDEVH